MYKTVRSLILVSICIHVYMHAIIDVMLNITQFIYLLKVERWSPQVSLGTFGALHCFMDGLFLFVHFKYLDPPRN